MAAAGAVAMVTDKPPDGRRRPRRIPFLTRWRMCADFVNHGLSYKQIAAKYSVHVNTAKRHIEILSAFDTEQWKDIRVDYCKIELVDEKVPDPPKNDDATVTIEETKPPPCRRRRGPLPEGDDECRIVFEGYAYPETTQNGCDTEAVSGQNHGDETNDSPPTAKTTSDSNSAVPEPPVLRRRGRATRISTGPSLLAMQQQQLLEQQQQQQQRILEQQQQQQKQQKQQQQQQKQQQQRQMQQQQRQMQQQQRQMQQQQQQQQQQQHHLQLLLQQQQHQQEQQQQQQHLQLLQQQKQQQQEQQQQQHLQLLQQQKQQQEQQQQLQLLQQQQEKTLTPGNFSYFDWNSGQYTDGSGTSSGAGQYQETQRATFGSTIGAHTQLPNAATPAPSSNPLAPWQLAQDGSYQGQLSLTPHSKINSNLNDDRHEVKTPKTPQFGAVFVQPVVPKQEPGYQYPSGRSSVSSNGVSYHTTPVEAIPGYGQSGRASVSGIIDPRNAELLAGLANTLGPAIQMTVATARSAKRAPVAKRDRLHSWMDISDRTAPSQPSSTSTNVHNGNQSIMETALAPYRPQTGMIQPYPSAEGYPYLPPYLVSPLSWMQYSSTNSYSPYNTALASAESLYNSVNGSSSHPQVGINPFTFFPSWNEQSTNNGLNTFNTAYAHADSEQGGCQGPDPDTESNGSVNDTTPEWARRLAAGGVTVTPVSCEVPAKSPQQPTKDPDSATQPLDFSLPRVTNQPPSYLGAGNREAQLMREKSRQCSEQSVTSTTGYNWQTMCSDADPSSTNEVCDNNSSREWANDQNVLGHPRSQVNPLSVASGDTNRGTAGPQKVDEHTLCTGSVSVTHRCADGTNGVAVTISFPSQLGCSTKEQDLNNNILVTNTQKVCGQGASREQMTASGNCGDFRGTEASHSDKLLQNRLSTISNWVQESGNDPVDVSVEGVEKQPVEGRHIQFVPDPKRSLLSFSKRYSRHYSNTDK